MRFLRFYSSAINFYEILDLPKNSTIPEIKKQFKILSKKFHPDLNSHLTEDEREANNDKFIRIVNAYETLKDKKKKKEYDMTLIGSFGSGSRGGNGFGDDRTFNYSYNSSSRDQYYGDSKHFSASRLNRTRHKVKNHSEFSDQHTSFNGRHINYGDRFDVPHFNYHEHLSKHLKFEQRIINKQLTKQERENILKQLTKNYDRSELDEELVTKHLMRQVNKKDKRDIIRSTFNMKQTDPFIYRRPTSTYSDYSHDEGSGFKTFAFLGGATGGLIVMYKVIFG